jgi:hypothetical protein
MALNMRSFFLPLNIVKYQPSFIEITFTGSRLTGDETTATEPLLDAFVTQVHEEETKELARIRKKLKLTQQQAANLTGAGIMPFPAMNVEMHDRCLPS